MKRIFIIIIVLFITNTSFSQSIYKENPKLVVGIVVDQMRYDYLIRFYDKYGEGGFKRLMNDGFNCKNTHFNYIPTYTAVGHTSIYTGTTPSLHGIIGNDWYDKVQKKRIYCVDDDNYTTVGAKKGGKKSPYRLQTTTITDQLKLRFKEDSKVIGISIKDRAAILPAGHSADAAFWFRGKKDAKFISSSYYMKKLPQWVKDFNQSNVAKNLLQVWNPLNDIATYTESISDNNNFEQCFKGESTPTFPHDLPKLMEENGNYDLLKASPFGNTLLEQFAEATIKGEKLGQNKQTDFLVMSFSSTDYMGHQYAPDSKEIEDAYLRLDKDLERFLNFLDNQIGNTNYSLFLTADHGAALNPSYLKSLKINAGYFNKKEFLSYLNEYTKTAFGSDKLVEYFYNNQIYLNKEIVQSLKLNYSEVTEKIKDKVVLFEGIYKAVTANTMQNTSFTNGVLAALQNGYNQKYSGDILIVFKPAYLYKKMKGTTHGTAYNYDTHVPLLFFGKGFSKGNTNKYITITQIAPTIANLLNIEFPSASNQNIIENQ